MARNLRLEYAGAMYHVMSRGDQRDDLFLDDEDRFDFLKTLSEACKKTDWQIHAFWTFLRPDSIDGKITRDVWEARANTPQIPLSFSCLFPGTAVILNSIPEHVLR